MNTLPDITLTSMNALLSPLLTESLCRYYWLPEKPVINRSNMPNVCFHFGDLNQAASATFWLAFWSHH